MISPSLQLPVTILTDFPLGSYAVIGHLYRNTIERGGLQVRELTYPPNEESRKKIAEELAGHVIFHNTIGPSFYPIDGAYNIALPAHEWSRYPQAWADTLNRFNEVWVTTDFVRSLLLVSGVTCAIHVLPPALDVDPIQKKTDWKPKAPFRFLAIGEAHFRKGFHLLMKGFLRAFSSPGEAELYIKTSPSCDWRAPREDIVISPKFLPRDELLGMYRNFDAYVTTSLGEGLGLPVAEAIFSRLPVAASFWGGHTSLLVHDSSAPGFFPIPFEETAQIFCSNPEYYAEGQTCAYSSPESVAKTFRRIVESSDEERQAMTKRALEHIKIVYSLDSATAPVVERISKIRL